MDVDTASIRPGTDAPAAPPSRDAEAFAPLPRRRPPGVLAALAVAALFFVALAPTLSWLEFSGGSENLVVAAVLEMHRGGPVLVPQLQGETRVKKPPLTTWISAAWVRATTVQGVSSPDPTVRDRAFRALAWEVRWPALLAACLTLVAAYALGRVLFDGTVGLVAALACGSTIMFLRFGRAATTDVHLALWVTVANACLAAGLFRGRVWTAWIGGGVALGLALMSKGPVALIQTLLPFGLFLLWRRWDRRAAGGQDGSSDLDSGGRRVWPLAAAVGLVLMVAMVLPWLVPVLTSVPDVWHTWLEEVSRADATELKPDPWYVYLVIFGYVAPWTAWFVAGAIIAVGYALRPSASSRVAASTERRQRADATVLSLFLLVVPILVMSLVKDKNERYLPPMTAPAAVLAAAALVDWVRAGRPRETGALLVRSIHWITLTVLAIGMPAAGVLVLKKIDGPPWFTVPQALAIAAAGVAVVAAGAWLSRRLPYAVVAATVALMLLLQYPTIDAYRDSVEGRAELKPLAEMILARYPQADVYEYDVAGRERVRYDLPIYLNRITRKAFDPAAMKPADRPQALVYFEGRKAAEPKLPPPWRFVGEGNDKKHKWRLYVLPAAPPPPAGFGRAGGPLRSEAYAHEFYTDRGRP